MGDAAHRARKSDHNQGNAIDITADPVSGPNLDRLTESFRRQMASFPGGRITYLIYRSRIASSVLDFEWADYPGLDPHNSHCHISIRADMRNLLRPWSITG
jgi:hypothetical protein